MCGCEVCDTIGKILHIILCTFWGALKKFVLVFLGGTAQLQLQLKRVVGLYNPEFGMYGELIKIFPCVVIYRSTILLRQ